MSMCAFRAGSARPGPSLVDLAPTGH